MRTGKPRYTGYRRQYDLDPTMRFNGHHTSIYGSGQVHIGMNSYLGWGCGVQADDGCAVNIGNDCAMSHLVRIYTSTRVADSPVASKAARTGSVTIGDGVWIGYGVYIGPGVSVGDGAVVGANAVVTKDVPCEPSSAAYQPALSA